MKVLPPELRDWYFPFNWDLPRLWALDVAAETRPIAEFSWYFRIPIWSAEPGMHFDLCPLDVIQHPGRSRAMTHEFRRRILRTRLT